MSVASPPRPKARPTIPRSLVEEQPLRYPDSGSREVMTRRGWWLVILNFLLPDPRRPSREARGSAGSASRHAGDVGSRRAGRALRDAVAECAPHPRHQLVRALPRPGGVRRLRRAVGRPHDRHPSPRPPGEDRTGSQIRHRRRRHRAHRPLERHGRLCRERRGCDAQHARCDLRGERALGAAFRRLLQHPAAGCRQRGRPRLDAVRQHLGGIGQRHHRRDDDHRHPA